ncbi:MAG TPA: SDR family NAD(P)-dependent oxidoreductase [Acidimicrobiia bacterium]|nr:SDR family NAD(P)-dependent oxidoreductase [Acidimicrobiia bacterium]
MRELAGKVAVVTGGGGGIGKALGVRFAQEGMKVVLADNDGTLLDATVDELRAHGFDVTGVVTDVRLLESVEALRDATLDAYGGVHVLCNNAGIGSGSQKPFWEQHVNDWRWSYDVNVFGVVNGINAFVPVMLAQDTEGHVVNTSSGNGAFVPLLAGTIYATTKAAVVTITECLWGSLRAIDAKVSASVMLPSTRTPGLLNTGIWRPGRNRPPEFAHEEAPPQEGRDALTQVETAMRSAGRELTFAPLEEIAEMTVDGIRDDEFWIYQGGDPDAARVRADSIVNKTPPDYMLQGAQFTPREDQ